MLITTPGNSPLYGYKLYWKARAQQYKPAIDLVNQPLPSQETETQDDEPAHENKSSKDFRPTQTPQLALKKGEPKSILAVLKEAKRTIQLHKRNPTQAPPPILTRGEQGIFYPNTVNLIQGKAGTHKSRLAAACCSAILDKGGFSFQTGIGLKAQNGKAFTVVYIDTERNLKYQLAEALGQMTKAAGYRPTDDPDNLEYTSLIDVPRTERQKAISEFIDDVRTRTQDHLVIVLDVITDCISNFNDEKESMSFLDYLNKLVNSVNATVVGVIHENPGGIKARGHLGTELNNKATVGLQISQYGADGETVIFKVDMVKNRSQKPFPPFYVKHDEDTGLLVTADKEAVSVAKSGRDKVTQDDVCKLLPDFLTGSRSRQELIDFLMGKLNRAERVIESLLKKIVEDNTPISNSLGSIVFLRKSATNPVKYSLIEEPA